VSTHTVIDNVIASRYEMHVDGKLCLIDYRRQSAGAPRIVNMTHAEVPAAMRGSGLGLQLVQGALDLARANNEKVIPSCPFVAAYIRRHAQYQDLVAIP
jgi:uncharacterized protein